MRALPVEFARATKVYTNRTDGLFRSVDASEFLSQPLLVERLRRFVGLNALQRLHPAQDLERGKAHKCSKNLLEKHILTIHLRPSVLCTFKVPIYDLEAFLYRGFNPDHLIEAIYSVLENSKATFNFDIRSHRENCVGTRVLCASCSYTLEQYKEDLIKVLLFIEQIGLARINRRRIEKAFVRASSVDLNIFRDSIDGTFFIDAAVQIQNPDGSIHIYRPEVQ